MEFNSAQPRCSVSRLAAAGIAMLLAVASASVPSSADDVDFNRDIRPILGRHCLECHGRDEANRQAGLRLDQRSAVVVPADSGLIPVVPGRPESSELVRRVHSADPDEMMPPPDSNRQLTSSEKQLLSRWVAAGAAFEQHWAFVTPMSPQPPVVSQTTWIRNPVDNFILAKLEDSGLRPAPEADWATLLRRLSLDLTGFPPAAGDLAALEMDILTALENAPGNPRAATDAVYARRVNRLLASPHFGERMAVDWLDAARFADTNGYQVDRDREMYAWRDWVINAFNANLPFDQFTIEQLAGDLLPDATLEQKIATGFHRNHMLNEEGGVLPEEFLAEYCADRVETTATVWLGQTFLCARCHDHKYDPFTQRDFYSLFAFFHNISELGVGNYGASIRRNAPPVLQLPAPELEARRTRLQNELAAARTELAEIEATITADLTEWEQRSAQSAVTWQPARLTAVNIEESAVRLDGPQTSARIPTVAESPTECVLESGWTLPRVTALRLDFTAAGESRTGSRLNSAMPDLQLSQLRVFRISSDADDPQPVTLRGIQVETSVAAAEVDKALVNDTEQEAAFLTLPGAAPSPVVVELDPECSSEQPVRLRVELSLTAPQQAAPVNLQIFATGVDSDLLLPTDIAVLVRDDSSDRTAEEVQQLTAFRKSRSAEHRQTAARIRKLDLRIDETDLQIPTTLVMQEMPEPRPTYILIRGAYNVTGDEVTAGTPAALPEMSADLPRNRLGLARWLVDPANPLTARVAVNRIWQSVFGQGIVRTAEDFGTQGEPPSHPQLLDWLATEFVRSGWDVKAMVRLLVHSSTYRQSSRLTPALRVRDPNNRLLSRGARYRLQAEFLRDQALAVSGLLVPRIGGPSVRPYHPPGLYEQVVAGSSARTYEVGTGSDLYRRSLYTYWKRSVPNPAMLLFDAPFRETCTMRRSRTNTPLQALNLMNDPTFVEAARCLARRMILEGGDSPAERIRYGFQLVLVRNPTAAELAILSAAYDRTVAEFRSDPEAADGLLSVGESPIDPQFDQAQLAALTTVASTILNLDEAVTKE